jgi:Na+:H+ antiporter, NhaB family
MGILRLFMADAPGWYKFSVLSALFLNLVLYFTTGPFITGWVILIEFLVVLALALQSYPLFPGGLLAIEVMALKMAPVEGVMKEIHGGMDVILLLMFMVPAIFFMKPLLSWIFLRVLRATKNKVVLSLVFLVAGAFLSAWLDALTVMAVMMTVCVGMKDLEDFVRRDQSGADIEEFNGFLRNLLMHGAIGTALGGVATLIGEPQNLLIGHYAGWGFRDFYVKMMPFSVPLQAAGLVLCFLLESFRMRFFGFGYQLPAHIATALDQHADRSTHTSQDKIRLVVMGIAFVALVLALALQIAPIGIIGLGLLVCLPLFTGQANEHALGKSFTESMPFTALLVVFFIIVAMIEAAGLFQPITALVLSGQGKDQLYGFFLASGILSAVSDNVFVASIYIHQAYNAFTQGVVDKLQFDRMAIIINLGTNIFSIATPNGQAAFLFLLTSVIARRINLSYLGMLWMAFPYAVVLISLAGMLI